MPKSLIAAAMVPAAGAHSEIHDRVRVHPLDREGRSSRSIEHANPLERLSQQIKMQGETERPLKTYEVKQENGTLLANIEGELTYDFDAAEDDLDDDDFFK
jgi:hypothetical protein